MVNDIAMAITKMNPGEDSGHYGEERSYLGQLIKVPKRSEWQMATKQSRAMSDRMRKEVDPREK